MKALITAGGRGTRLRPLTHTRNKHLIPIANKPMIHYAIEAVAAAGIRDIGISINPDTSDDLKATLGTGDAWGVRLTYIAQEAPLCLAHVVRVAEPYLACVRDPQRFGVAEVQDGRLVRIEEKPSRPKSD